MSLFGGFGEKTNKSTTNYSTTNTSTDTSANAGGDGSIAAGTGANVTINTLGEGLAGKAIDTSAGVAMGAINAIAGTQAMVYRDQESARNAATLSNQNNTSLAARLSELAVSNVADSKKDPNNATLETVAKYALIAAGVVVLGLVIIKTAKK